MTIGRFAPSPTGPLHFGSAVAALASFLQARSQSGAWHLRVDDLDRPRAIPGSDMLILDELQRLGLHWDGPVVYQSQRTEHYRAALERLRLAGWTYPCACTRREVGAKPYPGHCRNGLGVGRIGRSVRVRSTERITFDDRIQGRLVTELQETTGDFIVHRADSVPAYHLATVVDDAAIEADQIVRGADLLPVTPAQIHLQQALGLTVPEYAHIPVATQPSGEKLSKGSGRDTDLRETGGARTTRCASFPRAAVRGPTRRAIHRGHLGLGHETMATGGCSHPGPACLSDPRARPLKTCSPCTRPRFKIRSLAPWREKC